MWWPQALPCIRDPENTPEFKCKTSHASLNQHLCLQDTFYVFLREQPLRATSPSSSTHRPCRGCTHLQLLLGVSTQQVMDIFIVDLQVGGPDQKLGILCTLQGVDRQGRATSAPTAWTSWKNIAAGGVPNPTGPCPPGKLSPPLQPPGPSSFSELPRTPIDSYSLSETHGKGNRRGFPIVQVEKLRPQVRTGPSTGPGLILSSPSSGLNFVGHQNESQGE